MNSRPFYRGLREKPADMYISVWAIGLDAALDVSVVSEWALRQVSIGAEIKFAVDEDLLRIIWWL